MHSCFHSETLLTTALTLLANVADGVAIIVPGLKAIGMMSDQLLGVVHVHLSASSHFCWFNIDTLSTDYESQLKEHIR
jgi:hypothetical protein